MQRQFQGLIYGSDTYERTIPVALEEKLRVIPAIKVLGIMPIGEPRCQFVVNYTYSEAARRREEIPHTNLCIRVAMQTSDKVVQYISGVA